MPTEPIFERQGKGRKITDATDKDERRARQDALFWEVARAARLVAEGAELYRPGLYRIHPGLILRLRAAVEKIQPDMDRMTRSVARAEQDDER